MECKTIDLNEIATLEELQNRRRDVCSKYDDFMDALKKRRQHLQQALRYFKMSEILLMLKFV